MRKRIALFGYWERNLGDDLFLDFFLKEFSNYSIYILIKKKFKRHYKYDNLRKIYSDTLLYRLVNKMLRWLNYPELYFMISPFIADIGIMLGGSIFIESPKWKMQYVNLKHMIKKMSLTYIIGSNFGPFVDNTFFLNYSELFGHVSLATFREKSSFILFKEKANSFYFPDIVLGINKYFPINFCDNFSDYYVFSLIDLDNRGTLKQYSQDLEDSIIGVIENLVQMGNKIILMSFCDSERDINAINRVFNSLGPLQHMVQKYSHFNIADSIKIMYHSKGVVACRLHSMIIAFAYNIPCFPIAYSQKMINLMEDYHFDGRFATIQNIAQFNSKEIVHSLQNKPYIDSKLIADSFNHFEMIKQDLDKNILLRNQNKWNQRT